MIDAYCKVCGEALTFVRTAAGKKMPCNSLRVDFIEDPEGWDRVMNEDGVLVEGFIIDESCEGSEKMYIPHWATCKNPEAFRKPKAKRKPKRAAAPPARVTAAAREAAAQMALF